MVNSFQRSRLSSSERFIEVWTTRYLSSDSPLSGKDASELKPYDLDVAASARGRRGTLEKLSESSIKLACRRAALRTQDLYVYNSNSKIRNSAELVRFSVEAYGVLFKFYQTHTPIVVSSQVVQQTSSNRVFSVFSIPEITVLAEVLQPHLSIFQSRYDVETDWQTLSFLTTQLNLSGELLLETLDAAEQVLLRPYVSFLEEYGAIPWYQLYGAAASIESFSDKFLVVERMLAKVSEISLAVYIKWSQLFGGYYNRRGQLDNPGVKHSSIRDFSMFQVYLWLCVLQGNLAPIEQELVVLSHLVYEGLGIPWEMTVKGTQLLAKEIMNTLESDEQALVSPYTEGMVQIFTR